MTTHKSHCFWLTPLLLALVTTASLAERRIVLNPYETVAWEKHHRHHGSFHVHTTESDGRMDPAAVIDAHLAIDQTTSPFQGFETLAQIGSGPLRLRAIAPLGTDCSDVESNLICTN